MPRPIRQDIVVRDKTQAGFASVTRSVGKLKRLFGGLTAAYTFSQISVGLVRVVKETESLRASLKTVTGSAKAANQAFDDIKEFTSSTPFQISQVADAFIKLSAYGIKPTDKLMTSLGNTASALGKPLNQAVEALADAVVGEFERLKEFGIKARSEGDKVAFTFRGTTTVVKKNADEISRYLENIGATDFAGAMDRQMDTLGGAMSNLGDSVYNLAETFANESGFTSAVKDGAQALTDFFNVVEDWLREDADEEIARVGQALNNLKKKLAEEIKAQALLTVEFNLPDADAMTEEAQRLATHIDILAQKLEQLRGNNEPLTIGVSGGTESPPAPDPAAIKAWKEFVAEFEKLERTLDPVGAATDDYMDKVALLDRAWSKGLISGERWEQLMFSLAEGTEDAAEATDTMSRAMDLIDAEFEQLEKDAAKAFAGIADGVEEQKSQWSELGPIIGSAFEDAIVAGGELSDVLKGLEQDIIRLITRIAITRPLEQALTGIISGFDFGTIFGGARAAGGPVKRDMPYLVGEEGPELFVPNSSGSIVPNDALRSTTAGGMIGGEVTVNVVNNANGAQASVNERTEGGNKIIDIMIDQVKNSIAGDISRGAGPIPGAMQQSYGLNRVAGAY